MSLFEHGLRKSDDVPLNIPGWPAIRVENTADAFNLFAIEKAQFWNAFVTKWLAKARDHKNVVAFDYDALVSSADAMELLARFCLDEFEANQMHRVIGKQIEFVNEGEITLRSPDDFLHPWKPAAELMRQVISDEAMSLAGFDDVV